MNNDLISRSALLEEIKRIGGHPWSDWETAGVVSMVNAIPAVDAVEVVRCKDCTFCKPSAAPGRFFCDWYRDYFETFPDDFCIHGERRVDDATD